MPWKKMSALDQRIRFVRDYLSGDYTKKALCRHYGISRPTGDKWIERYRLYGLGGLYERSKRPRKYGPPKQ
jgi:transposase-like protein